jgi:hypothetical protein
MAGRSFADIAKREDKTERQIRLLMPLAFPSPAVVRGTLDGLHPNPPIMDLAKSIPLAWSEPSMPLEINLA